MLVSRIVRAVNYALAGTAALALVALWWLFWRTLPDLSGETKAPVSAGAQIVRDELGTPHISAGTIEDALFAQGYATAQDRLWQMDALRRLAAGDLAEVVGMPGLESDIMARRLRIRRIAEEALKGLAPREKAFLGAYARGVNHFIETSRGKWGPEFLVLRYEPRAWTMADSLMIVLQMDKTLSNSWERDLRKAKLLAQGDKAKVDRLFPDRTGEEPRPGSNAWAVAGRLTASGRPILANDMHLEYSMPSTWHMVDIRAPGLHAAGVTLPGLPGVVVGHNERIAWGATSLQFDVQDLYVEEIDLRSGRYRAGGEEREARREMEWIAVKGRPPVQFVDWVTEHGPIVKSENGKNYALKWMAAQATGFSYPVLDLNAAKNWEDFRAALKRLPGPGLNFVYADVNGNIGLQVAGRIPARRGFRGDVPLDGAGGKQEWGMTVPFEELPSQYNPASGMVVTANQNPFPEGTEYAVGGPYASHHRAKLITDRLKEKAKWTVAETLAVQKDVYSAFLKFLADEAMRAVEKRGEKTPQAVEGARILKGWNGQVEKDMAQPLVAVLLYHHLRRAVAERASPKEGAAYREFIAPGVVQGLVRERPRDWFDDWDFTLASELADAVDEAKRMQGRNPAKWRYGRMSEVTLAHPIFGNVPVVGKYFRIGPVEMSGTETTIKQMTGKIAPSMRFVADVGNWDGSLMNLPAGESGHVASGHYKDQWEAYYVGESFPFAFEKVKAEKTLRLEP